MDKIVFYATYPLLWAVSRLPLRLLYVVSNLLYYLLYYLVGYRKKVVLKNLELAFPDKSLDERLEISRKFYRHLSDIFIEMIRSISISREEVMKRMTFTNPELLNELEHKYSSIFVLMGHYANWEWTIALNNYVNHHGYAIYQPIANRYFDQMFRKNRATLGATLLSVRDTRELMKTNYDQGKKSIYGMITDQSPTLHRPAYWGNFFGHRVPIHIGAEKLAKRSGSPMVIMHIDKIRRGYYQGTLTLLSENPVETPDYELAERFMTELESRIRLRPELYFWTHKRWKHLGKEQPENSINYRLKRGPLVSGNKKLQ